MQKLVLARDLAHNYTLDVDARQRSLTNLGDPLFLRPLLHSLRSHQPVTIGVLGASVAQNGGCLTQPGKRCMLHRGKRLHNMMYGEKKPHKGFAVGLFEMMNRTWPHPHHRLVNAALDGTPAQTLLPCLFTHLPRAVQLVIIEFGSLALHLDFPAVEAVVSAAGSERVAGSGSLVRSGLVAGSETGFGIEPRSRPTGPSPLTTRPPLAKRATPASCPTPNGHAHTAEALHPIAARAQNLWFAATICRVSQVRRLLALQPPPAIVFLTIRGLCKRTPKRTADTVRCNCLLAPDPTLHPTLYPSTPPSTPPCTRTSTRPCTPPTPPPVSPTLLPPPPPGALHPKLSLGAVPPGGDYRLVPRRGGIRPRASAGIDQEARGLK